MLLTQVLARHFGRQCRNPEAIEGISRSQVSFASPQFHTPVNWITAIPAGMSAPVSTVLGRCAGGREKPKCAREVNL